jgi:hypothetical protein
MKPKYRQSKKKDEMDDESLALKLNILRVRERR